MNKQTLTKIFFVLLPALAVGLAYARDSVMVFDTITKTAVYGSYFDLIPEAGNFQVLPPLAAILAVVATVLALAYVATNRDTWVKALRWVASISAAAAALPVAVQGDVLVVPNVVFPLLMAFLFLICNPFGKKAQQKKGNTGFRLDKH